MLMLLLSLLLLLLPYPLLTISISAAVTITTTIFFLFFGVCWSLAVLERFDPDEPPRSYLQSREESMQNENEGSIAASPGTMLGRHLGRLNFPGHRR